MTPGVFALCAIVASADAAASDPLVREQFRAAYAAAAVGAETEDTPELRSYILYPYLRAARLSHALARAQGAWSDDDAAAAEFLSQAGEGPLALEVRGAWLASLARRASWET